LRRKLANISQTRFESLKSALKQRLGSDFDGNEGTVESHGFQAGIQYDPDKRELVIVLLKKPRLMPEWLIERNVDAWLSRHGVTWLGPDFVVEKT